MILEFYNISSENIKVYFYNMNKVIVIRPCERCTLVDDGEEIQFAVSSNKSSRYGVFKRTEFQVLSKYFLSNRFDKINIIIERQEAEDKSFRKYIRFVCKEEALFEKIEYTVIDSKNIKNKEQKSVLICHLLCFFDVFFSAVNVVFIAVAIAIGGYFEAKHGVICYIVLFSIYFIIEDIIYMLPDRKLSVTRFMSNEYITHLFSNF